MKLRDVLYLYYDNLKQCTVLVDFRQEVVYVDLLIETFIDQSCRQFGASMQTRKSWAQSIIKRERKVPIMVSETNRIILLPIYKGLWVQYRKIEKIKDNHDGTSTIIFCDGSNLNVELGIRSLRKRFKECGQLYAFLKDL